MKYSYLHKVHKLLGIVVTSVGIVTDDIFDLSIYIISHAVITTDVQMTPFVHQLSVYLMTSCPHHMLHICLRSKSLFHQSHLIL